MIKKKIITLILVGVLGFLGIVGRNGISAQGDLMETLFKPPQVSDQVINIGNNKNAVGNQIFRGGIVFKGGKFVTQEPLLTKITKLLLRLTIAFSIPVIIYIGIKIIKNALSGAKLQEGLKQVGYVALGLIIALAAMTVIYVIQSLVGQTLIPL